jgi:hypothetical protein
MLAGFVGLCARRSVHPLVWTLLPFILFHLLLPTKELRFLYPMLLAAPFVIVFGVDSWWPSAFVERHSVAMRIVVALLVAANGSAFAARLWIPMEPVIAAQEMVYRSGQNAVIVLGDRDPYVWWGLHVNWYRRAGLRVVHAPSPQDARRLAESTPGAQILTRAPELPDTGEGTCRLVHASVPLRIAERWRALFSRFTLERDLEPGWWYVARCGPSRASP